MECLDWMEECDASEARPTPRLCFDLVDKVFHEVGVARENKGYSDNHMSMIELFTQLTEDYAEEVSNGEEDTFIKYWSTSPQWTCLEEAWYPPLARALGNK